MNVLLWFCCGWRGCILIHACCKANNVQTDNYKLYMYIIIKNQGPRDVCMIIMVEWTLIHNFYHTWYTYNYYSCCRSGVHWATLYTCMDTIILLVGRYSCQAGDYFTMIIQTDLTSCIIVISQLYNSCHHICNLSMTYHSLHKQTCNIIVLGECAKLVFCALT